MDERKVVLVRVLRIGILAGSKKRLINTRFKTFWGRLAARRVAKVITFAQK